MARTAIILAEVADAFGDLWDIGESRPTPHRWLVLLGWPHGEPRGKGGTGGKRVVLTHELAAYLCSMRPRDLDLPIGRTTIKRLRNLLGLDWREERRQWWEERSDALASMTITKFAAAYHLSQARVSQAHKAIFGPRIRRKDWWRAPYAADLLRGDLPRLYVAEALGISVGAVGRLRWVLRNQ